MKIQLMIEVEPSDNFQAANSIENANFYEKTWLKFFGLEKYVISLAKRLEAGQVKNISFDVRVIEFKES